ncbi:MAG: hypothetical protein KDM91_08870 [Verrucomicrobiae bacterium]|nr:hypothetical protein [Verrucomicrobiae bacterium]MCP5541680.1 hypothetical protein [Akkermansiaceae bacterium]MCP5551668.1 hypothetical protein [Akkermansiaceae bacterium]
MKRNLATCIASAGIAVTILLGMTGPAGADTTVVYDDTKPTGESSSVTVKIAGGKMALLLGDGQKAVFDSATEELVHTGPMGTFRLKPETLSNALDAASAAMAEARKKMEETLKNLPPEQQAIMRRFMEEKFKPPGGGGAPAEAPTLTDTGRTTVIDGRTAAILAQSEGGVTTAEFFVVPHESVGMPKEDYAVFEAFARFAEKMQAGVSGKKKQPGLDSAAIRDGRVPLRTVKYDDRGTGTVRSTQSVRSITTEKVDPATFEHPPATDPPGLGDLRGLPVPKP